MAPTLSLSDWDGLLRAVRSILPPAAATAVEDEGSISPPVTAAQGMAVASGRTLGGDAAVASPLLMAQQEQELGLLLYSLGGRISDLLGAHCRHQKQQLQREQQAGRPLRRRPPLVPPLVQKCQGPPGAAAASMLYTYASLRCLHTGLCSSAASMLLVAPGHVSPAQAGLALLSLGTLVGPTPTQRGAGTAGGGGSRIGVKPLRWHLRCP